MISLLIDTSNEKSVAALYDDKTCVAVQEFRSGFGSGQKLLEVVTELFSSSKLDKNDIAYVAVGRGPGSYTGIRAGVAFAKGLTLGLGIPLVGVSSLKGYRPPSDFKSIFTVAIDAKIGGFYTLQGKVEKEQIIYTADEALTPLDEFQKLIEKTDIVITPQQKPILARIPEIINIAEANPSIEALHTEARRLYADGAYSLDGTCEILYLRKTQAELEKK